MPCSNVKGNCASWMDGKVDLNTNVLIVTDSDVELYFVDNIIRFDTCKDLRLNRATGQFLSQKLAMLGIII